MRYSFVFILFFLFIYKCFSQVDDNYKIMFYNVENLFDTYDDSLTVDEEFLPEGERFWNNYKYYTKLNQIYKVIIAIGEWNPPAIVGLCELENRKVLKDLTQNTPLLKYNYQIIHKESPDRRGIDVGLLYRKELFSPLIQDFIPINFPNNPSSKTRDILYVKGLTNKKDTLHVFINHWPSRWGGQLESENRRVFVASVLKTEVDSIFSSNPNSNIIITGDFNDYPDNKSIKEVLQANQSLNNITYSELYNLSYNISASSSIGTHKYQGEWGILDQFIVSGNLLNTENQTFLTKDNVYIYNADFLLEKDDSYFGLKPKRTFIGYKYNGGFSDHLPIYIILNFNK